MITDGHFERMFAGLGVVRMGFGVLLGLFLLLFVAIIVEELFLGGRRRRQAERHARLNRDDVARPGE